MHDHESPRGLTILRASRLEGLVGPLHTLLKQTQPDAILAPQTVIAAHPGMKPWLTGALARQAGAGRIVANLEVILPSSWLDHLSASQLGERAVALPRYRRANLRWTLHTMLGEPERHGIEEPRLLAYLDSAAGADERGLRRFQLADRLAGVFSQYLVYRGDWLSAWEAGLNEFATAGREDAALRALEARCLAPLWRAVAGQLGEHRGRLVTALHAALATGAAPLMPLHVFGLSHLPPAELEVLRAYARRAPVFLYVPDPCREYWGGLHRAAGEGAWRAPDRGAWDRYRSDEAGRLHEPDALDWNEQGHPLLARWGRLGQHFFAALVEGEVREDIRHWRDEGATEPHTRLARLQESIRRLQPELLEEDVGLAVAGHAGDEPVDGASLGRQMAASADASLRIHACHTRLRELEVLRDALLDAIDVEGVRPGAIVVMAPDIRAYLPLIPAVFGEPGSTRERLLPYHLADVPIARSHALYTVFDMLLGLGAARVTGTEVVDLLGVAEVRAALALDPADADALVQWLRQSRVAWALDGAHKRALSLPPRAEHSFAWAMDRLLAGYLMADLPGEVDPQPVTLPDGTQLLPLAGIEGPSAAALGSLDRLLCELQAWRDLAQLAQPASRWAEALRARVDALIRIDPTDADARAAHSLLHLAIANLAGEPARNGEDPELRLPVVRELLQDVLAAAPERQRFLMGGITFCGMVPQRAIPFDVVCVLGLDEGAFPRRPADGGIDLMPRLRRLGDRDVPGDDRYLFLETVMSARRRLHLSYIGQGVRDDKPRNPAAPLAELMAELEARCGIAPDDDQAPRPWLVRHPLQPFDGRYFDGTHPALFSYSAAFAGMRGDGRARLPGLRDGARPTAEPLPDPLPLATLEGFFRDPAKALLQEHLQLSLEALDDDARLAQDEPMDAIGRIHAVARRVFLQQVLPRKSAAPDWEWDRRPPAWVSHGGLLPPGAAGEEAWAKEAAAVEALWRAAQSSGRFGARAQGGGQAIPVDVPLALPGDAGIGAAGPRRLTGLLRNVFALEGSEDGVQVVLAFPSTADHGGVKKPEALTFADRVPAFLHWAVLRLQRAHGDAPAPVLLTMLAEGEPDLAAQCNAWDRRYRSADPATRGAMAADLRHRLRALVELLQAGREGRSWFYPRSAWKAICKKPEGAQDLPAWAAAVAKDVAGVWVAEFGEHDGERDFAPGFARLLEGELIFGDPEADPGNRVLHALLRDAEQVNALILLGGSGGTDTDHDEVSA